MQLNRRRFLRFEVEDFLEIRPLNEVAKKNIQGKAINISMMGICFSSGVSWKKGQVLFIDYFIPEQAESITLKVMVSWSEFIDDKQGYLTGCELLEIESGKETLFINYYYHKLKERFFND